MNMILHGYPTAEIWQGNTLSIPHFTKGDGGLKTFDFAVANPPFSTKAWSNGVDPAEDTSAASSSASRRPRTATTPSCCTSSSRSRAPARARSSCRTACCSAATPRPTSARNIVRRGYIKGIIGLPANLFYGTGIPACIIVLDKENAARPQGHLHDRRLQGLHQGRQQEPPPRPGHPQDRGYFHRQVEIAALLAHGAAGRDRDPKNDYNLNIPRYIDSTEPEDLQDIDAHLHGGIPTRDMDALDRYWQVFPACGPRCSSRPTALATASSSCRAAEIKPAIFGHPEFTAFNAIRHQAVRQVAQPIRRCWTAQPGGHPKALIETLSEDLLETFRQAAAARPLRHVPAPDGLLGGDHAGRRLPGGARRLEGGAGRQAQHRPDAASLDRAPLFRQGTGRHRTSWKPTETPSPARWKRWTKSTAARKACWPKPRPKAASSPRPSVKARLAEIKRDKDAADERNVLKEYPG